MSLIGKIEQFKELRSYPLTINGKNLLLIRQQNKFHLIENKCGHFGVELNDATIIQNEIICAQHGISFDLNTGKVVNRPYENCDPIQVYPLIQREDELHCNEL